MVLPVDIINTSAKTIEPEDRDVNFALALCFYKLKRYSSAIELLEKYCVGLNTLGGQDSKVFAKDSKTLGNEKDEGPAENSGTTGSGNSSVMNISSEAVQTYILSICYKGANQFSKAEITYNKFLGMIDDSSNREVALYLFALLNKSNSGFSVRKMEEIKMGLLRSFKCLFPEEVESVSKYWDTFKSCWNMHKKDQFIETLQSLAFFKRFPSQILLDAMVHCKFEILKKDSIIFYTPETEEKVYVIVKGSITVKDHSLNIEVPRTATQMQPGDVINPGQTDGDLLGSFHFWFRCATDVECISMSRQSYENFWFAQSSFGLDTTCIIFKKMNLFQKVSEMTVSKIVYDLMTTEIYDRPTIVYDDLSYFEEYEAYRQKAFENKLKNAKDQMAMEYLR